MATRRRRPRPKRPPEPSSRPPAAAAVPDRVGTGDLVIVGRIGSPHGIAGALRIISSTDPPGNMEHYRPWLVGRDDDFREMDVAWLKPHGDAFLARFDGIEDRDRASALTGLLVAVPRSALPAPESDTEYYWQDLMGMTVTDTAGKELGRVDRLLATGAHDVLVIAGERGETLVPFVDAFVVDVDLAAGRIRVDWQERD